jgi:hypothetical protein
VRLTNKRSTIGMVFLSLAYAASTVNFALMFMDQAVKKKR